jgi:hypothetical protein
MLPILVDLLEINKIQVGRLPNWLAFGLLAGNFLDAKSL